MSPCRIFSILSGVLALILAGDLRATPSSEDPAQIFARGNSLYQQGDFVAAQQQYLQLLAGGITSGSTYYNLGNACFKQKKLGEAIYYWEKALQRLPGDPDITENLELSSLLIVDRVELPAEPYPLKMLRNVAQWFSLAQLSWVTLLLVVTTHLFLAAFLLLPGPRFVRKTLICSLTIGCLALLCAGMLTWRIYDAHYRHEGIIVAQSVEVRSGPGTDNTAIFTVHEGIRVRVRTHAGDWFQVVLPNGWNGWLQQDALRIL